MIVECETTVGAVNSRKNIAENLVKCIEIVQLFFSITQRIGANEEINKIKEK